MRGRSGFAGALLVLALVQTAAWIVTRWMVGGDLGGLEISLALLPTYGALHWLVRRHWTGLIPSGHLDLVVGVPLLWFVGLHHEWLSSPGSERLIAAVVYLTAAWVLLRTCRSVGALRQARIGWRERRRAPVLLAVLAFAFLALLTPWKLSQRGPDGDEPWYLLVTHSLAYDFDAALDDNYQRNDSLAFMDRAIGPQPGDPTDGNGRLRSRHGSALPLLLAPSYRLAGRTGAALTMAALTSLFGWLMLQWTLEIFGVRAAVLRLFVLTVITSPLLLYASQIWVEVPAGVLAACALLALERLRGGLDRGHLLGLILSVSLLPLLKVRFGLLSVALVAVALVRLPLDRKQRLTLAALGGLGLLGVMAINAVRFGNPLRNHGWEEILMPFTSIVPMVQRLIGFLFDPAFGLVAFAPFWLLILPGLWWLARDARAQATGLVVVFGPYLVFAASRQEWYGGWSPPFRYALVCLPLAVTAVAAALLHRRRLGARVLWAPLAALSVALGALWTAVPGWTFNFANGSALWLDRLTQLTGVDWMLIAPSATRPSRASWVVPALMAVAVLAAWTVGPRGNRRRSVTLGACVTLVLLVTFCLAIARMPTTHIEAESTRVAKTGGHPEPPRWTFDRTRFPEAWTLPNGTELVVPVRPGGSQVEIEISRLFIRNRMEDMLLHVERHVGDGRYEPIGGLRLQQPGWHIDRLGPIDWGDADRLRLRTGAPLFDREPGVVNGVAVDWVHLRWR